MCLLLSLRFTGFFSFYYDIPLRSETGSSPRTGLHFYGQHLAWEKRTLFSKAFVNTICAVDHSFFILPFPSLDFDPPPQGLFINLIKKSSLKPYQHEAPFRPPQECRRRKLFEKTPAYISAEPKAKSSMFAVPGWVGGALTLQWLGQKCDSDRSVKRGISMTLFGVCLAGRDVPGTNPLFLHLGAAQS